ncbi:MAG: hypothetical protein ACR2O3_04715 [Rhizobiaceae bacterium]
MAFAASLDSAGVWVTGANADIGRTLENHLAQEGYTLYVSARSAEKLALSIWRRALSQVVSKSQFQDGLPIG